MKILTWQASDDAPTAHRWLARFLTDKGFLPVFCTAKTEAEVIAKAQAFWDSETDKWAKRDGRKPASTADSIIERVGQPDPVEKDVGQTDTPATRYFYHPESDSLMISEDGSHPGTDGLVEEIDRAKYVRIAAEQVLANGTYTPGPAATTDNDLSDLLG
jgi:hypothetical protein